MCFFVFSFCSYTVYVALTQRVRSLMRIHAYIIHEYNNIIYVIAAICTRFAVCIGTRGVRTSGRRCAHFSRHQVPGLSVVAAAAAAGAIRSTTATIIIAWLRDGSHSPRHTLTKCYRTYCVSVCVYIYDTIYIIYHSVGNGTMHYIIICIIIVRSYCVCCGCNISILIFNNIIL